MCVYPCDIEDTCMYPGEGLLASKTILQSGAGSADSAGLEALVIDHGEADRTLVHHQLGVDTLAWGIGGRLPGNWSCEDSVPCPLVSETPCQLHPSCLMTHMGIPFLTPYRPTSQVVPCSQRLHGQLQGHGVPLLL